MGNPSQPDTRTMSRQIRSRLLDALDTVNKTWEVGKLRGILESLAGVSQQILFVNGDAQVAFEVTVAPLSAGGDYFMLRRWSRRGNVVVEEEFSDLMVWADGDVILDCWNEKVLEHFRNFLQWSPKIAVAPILTEDNKDWRHDQKVRYEDLVARRWLELRQSLEH